MLENLTAGRELMLDGEIIAQNLTDAPSFGLLQRRMHHGETPVMDWIEVGQAPGRRRVRRRKPVRAASHSTEQESEFH